MTSHEHPQPEQPLYPEHSLFSVVRDVYGNPIDSLLMRLKTEPQRKARVLIGQGGLGKSTFNESLEEFLGEKGINILYDHALVSTENFVGVKSDDWAALLEERKRREQDKTSKQRLYEYIENTNPVDEIIDYRELVSRLLYGAGMRHLGLPFYPEFVDSAHAKRINPHAPRVTWEIPGGFGPIDRGRETVKWLLQALHPEDIELLVFIPHPDVLQTAAMVRETVTIAGRNGRFDEIVGNLRDLGMDPNPAFARGNPVHGKIVYDHMQLSAPKYHILDGNRRDQENAMAYFTDPARTERMAPFMEKMIFPGLSEVVALRAVQRAGQAIDQFAEWIPADWSDSARIITPIMIYPYPYRDFGGMINLGIPLVPEKEITSKDVRAASVKPKI